MPKTVRVGRSAVNKKNYLFFLPKDILWAKSEEKFGLQKKGFSGDLCNKKNLGSGPFPRDGRVTGNKHIFVLGLVIHACLPVILVSWLCPSSSK